MLSKQVLLAVTIQLHILVQQHKYRLLALIKYTYQAPKMVGMTVCFLGLVSFLSKHLTGSNVTVDLRLENFELYFIDTHYPAFIQLWLRLHH